MVYFNVLFSSRRNSIKSKNSGRILQKYGRDFNKLLRIYNIAGVITQERTGIQIDKNNLLFANHEEWTELIIKIHKELGMNTFIFWPSSKNKSEQIKIFSEKVKEIIRQSFE
jgi:hypothetical protein